MTIQIWHIRADDHINGGYLEFDLTHHQIEKIIIILCKQKHNLRIGKVFKEVYEETNPNAKERIGELGIQ
jgi:hypothetical protein